LTSISQPQFWSEAGAFESRYGDGAVRGLISVDVSDWFTPGLLVRKAARDCTPDEIAREVWHQLCAGANSRSERMLTEDDVVAWHLDDELEVRREGGVSNRAQLLVHPPGSWRYRPEAASTVRNLTIAADFVRTHTDLATMEGANEAARRAVNEILDRTESAHQRCHVWSLREPSVFARAKALDERLLDARDARRHAFDRIQGTASSVSALGSALGRVLAGAA
jgi:uncharacterized protein with NAD-binding domain and iron-sulfur cluster